jgi:small subunit ribosomal protein S9
MAETEQTEFDPTDPAHAEAGGDTATATIPQREPAKPDAGGFIWGTGRRKSAVARVRIRKGEGKFQINGKEVADYFSEPQDQEACHAPLKATNMAGQFDVFVNAHGGGITGQAEAVLLGLARALSNYDPALEPMLRDRQYLTRDPRETERKKYGQPGARKKFQFSKR